jgi:hypothetical protein
MFVVHCPDHGQSVLLSAGNIRRIDGAGADLTIHWTCWCGHHGASRPHGSRTPAAAASAATPASPPSPPPSGSGSGSGSDRTLDRTLSAV